MNNNRTYYGEYSLAYWIQMILKRNIVLPEYQRTFVWNAEFNLQMQQNSD